MIYASFYYKNVPIIDGAEFTDKNAAENFAEKEFTPLQKKYILAVFQTREQYIASCNDAVNEGNPDAPVCGSIRNAIAREQARIENIFIANNTEPFFKKKSVVLKWGEPSVMVSVISTRLNEIFAFLDDSSVWSELDWTFLPKEKYQEYLVATND